MASDFWTDPSGKQQQYGVTGGRFENARRGLERERVWRETDPKFDSENYGIREDGTVYENRSMNPWLAGALTLAAPLAVGLGGPALLGAGGGSTAAAGGATALPGASAAPTLSTLLGAAPAAAGTAGTTGMLGTLAGLGKGLLKDPGKLLGAAGSMLGGAGQAAAQNRGAEMDAMVGAEEVNRRRERDFYDFLLAREQEGRAGSTDAMRKLQQGEYLAGGGSQYRPGKYSYGFGPQATTGAERAGGSAVSAESLGRLQGGNPMPMPATPQPFSFGDLMKPGMFEKIANIAGPGLTFAGMFDKMAPKAAPAFPGASSAPRLEDLLGLRP